MNGCTQTFHNMHANVSHQQFFVNQITFHIRNKNAHKIYGCAVSVKDLCMHGIMKTLPKSNTTQCITHILSNDTTHVEQQQRSTGPLSLPSLNTFSTALRIQPSAPRIRLEQCAFLVDFNVFTQDVHCRIASSNASTACVIFLRGFLEIDVLLGSSLLYHIDNESQFCNGK